jgi:hypothetical protein
MARMTRIKANRQLVVVVLPAVRSELALVIGRAKADWANEKAHRPPPTTGVGRESDVR